VHRSRAFWDGSSSQQGTPGSSTKRPNNLMLFDKKVSEADAYLQLLIDQAAVMEDVWFSDNRYYIYFFCFFPEFDHKN
jgi:hypothetical protein